MSRYVQVEDEEDPKEDAETPQKPAFTQQPSLLEMVFTPTGDLAPSAARRRRKNASMASMLSMDPAYLTAISALEMEGILEMKPSVSEVFSTAGTGRLGQAGTGISQSRSIMSNISGEWFGWVG